MIRPPGLPSLPAAKPAASRTTSGFLTPQWCTAGRINVLERSHLPPGAWLQTRFSRCPKASAAAVAMRPGAFGVRQDLVPFASTRALVLGEGIGHARTTASDPTRAASPWLFGVVRSIVMHSQAEHPAAAQPPGDSRTDANLPS